MKVLLAFGIGLLVGYGMLDVPQMAEAREGICAPEDTQIIHTDGAAISEFVIDRNVKCVTVINEGN